METKLVRIKDQWNPDYRKDNETCFSYKGLAILFKNEMIPVWTWGHSHTLTAHPYENAWTKSKI